MLDPKLMEVDLAARHVMFLAQAATAVALLVSGAICLGALPAEHGLIEHSGMALRMVAVYGLTVLAFAAFPGSRRNDLAGVILTLGALAEVARGVLYHDLNIFVPMVEGVAVMAVYIPAHLEALRCAMRETPYGPAFRPRRLKDHLPLVAAVLVGGIVFATLGPQGLRPHLGDPQLERFGAFSSPPPPASWPVPSAP